jgi:hypothetical protein
VITDLFAPSRVDRALQAARQQVELIGPHLRLRGAVEMRGFRRLFGLRFVAERLRSAP